MAAFLTESSKSPAGIAQRNKQWVGTCLYQEWCKPLLISWSLQSATGTLQPSAEGLTAYRYGSTHVLIITIKNNGCSKKMAEEVVGEMNIFRGNIYSILL